MSPTPFNINDVGYFVSLELVDRALERLEIFPANLLLKLATSAAKMYHLLAIAPIGEPFPTDADRWFKSFRLTTAADH